MPRTWKATGPDIQDLCISKEIKCNSDTKADKSIHHNLDELEQSLQAETGKETYLQGSECVYHSYLMLSFSHGSYSSPVVFHKQL